MPSTLPIPPHPETEYPLIDADPYIGRVVRYMRPTDYATWAGVTAGMPGLIYLWERMDPQRVTATQLRSAMRVNAVLGFFGGFLLAYQSSSKRFWGFTENAREIENDYQELSSRAKAGLPLYGESELTPYMQGVAARNSTWSQLKFSALPWFNVVNHNSHGVDTSKYYKDVSSQLS